ncbi:MAG: Holliday junction branch migration protein RuvA [Actinobacteria bacterium]|nr:Holliday junction branch migration protein RuvA [Actinomycetota bacterium]
MIGSLRGVLLDRSPTGEVLVEVGGVGYRATVAPTTLAAMGDLGSQVFLHMHTHVREDALILYGFATLDERRCFEALIGAHGVGPALALAILSVHSPSALRRALLSDDVDALTLVPGVGKKTAARLLVELKSRLDVPEVELVPVGALGTPAEAARAEVRAALAGLGYAPDEIRSVVIDLGDGPVEDMLRSALKQLAVAR